MEEDNKIVVKTINHQCSRCGDCCGLFIPFTEKELTVIKNYVKEHNIKPVDRINKVTGQFEAHCCFYDSVNKKCTIYEARPFVCKDFKCDRKDWKKRRIQYEKRAKYNSSFTNKTILATFDDKVYEDYVPIIKYVFNMAYESSIKHNQKGLDSNVLIYALKRINRLDLLNYITAFVEGNKEVKGKDLLNER